MNGLRSPLFLGLVFIMCTAGYCKEGTEHRDMRDSKTLLNLIMETVNQLKKHSSQDVENSVQYLTKQNNYTFDPKGVHNYKSYNEDQRVEIFPRDLRTKEKFLNHLTGPLYFSPKCTKHFHRLYHNTRDCTIPASKELEQFLGIVLYMSLFGLPATRLFWCSFSRVTQVADTLPLTRWEAIKRFLHFNDNNAQPGREEGNFDELYKIRPLITHLVSKMNAIPMSEKLSVDEQMVPFKGRRRLKQYLPMKLRKWGYKVMVLAGSDGISHNFEVYTGKVLQPPELADVGASGNVVLRLAQPVPKHKNYKLYFDNWGFNVLAPFVPTDYQACVGDVNFHAVKWYDNRSVTLLSDYVGAHPVTEVERWDRSRKMVVQVPCPAVVREYNRHMGGVDLLDSLIALYRTKVRSKKWYHRMVFHFLDMTVVTALLLYRWDCDASDMLKEEQIRLYSFKSYIAQSLCKCRKNLERKREKSIMIDTLSESPNLPKNTMEYFFFLLKTKMCALEGNRAAMQ
ncbi:Protein FAM150B [Acipenser ruthenus]|uniref:Protein FAM150B n=1 Tax=Acipenser ruthenus TaxID=7906 RepID=A0A444TW70_ACIRT|nr:Protein FAM150B [Acipenser ruthenus]